MAIPLLGVKIIAAFCQSMVSLTFILLPIKVSGWMQKLGEKGELMLSCFRCFGGGALLGMYMLHMTPEIRYLLQTALLDPQGLNFPVPEVIAGAGFFLLVFMEWGVTLLDTKEDEKAEEKRHSRWEEHGVINDWLQKNRLDTLPEINIEDETEGYRNSSGVELRHPPPARPGGGQYQKSGYPGAASRARHSYHSGRLTAVNSDPRVSNTSSQQAHSYHSGRLTLYQSAPVPAQLRRVRESYRATRMNPVAARVSLDPVTLASMETDTPSQAMAEPENSTRSVILLIALSTDGLLAGIALGLQRSPAAVWSMLISIFSNEFVVAFCLGLELVRSNPTRRVIISGICYSCVPAVGSTIGIIIFETSGDTDDPTSGYLVNGILQSIATGVFLYVAFVGILGEELTSHPTIWALLSVLGGYTMLALLCLLEGAEDEPPMLPVTTAYTGIPTTGTTGTTVS